MRVATGGIIHETNTYCDAPTTIDGFQVLRGASMLDQFRGGRNEVSAFMDFSTEHEIELIPTFYADGQPSGTIEAATYQTMRGDLYCGRHWR